MLHTKIPGINMEVITDAKNQKWLRLSNNSAQTFLPDNSNPERVKAAAECLGKYSPPADFNGFMATRVPAEQGGGLIASRDREHYYLSSPHAPVVRLNISTTYGSALPRINWNEVSRDRDTLNAIYNLDGAQVTYEQIKKLNVANVVVVPYEFVLKSSDNYAAAQQRIAEFYQQADFNLKKHEIANNPAFKHAFSQLKQHAQKTDAGKAGVIEGFLNQFNQANTPEQLEAWFATLKSFNQPDSTLKAAIQPRKTSFLFFDTTAPSSEFTRSYRLLESLKDAAMPLFQHKEDNKSFTLNR